MKPKRLTWELNIPTDDFISSVKDRIEKYKRDSWDDFTSLPPHFEFDKVKITDNRLVIQKSWKFYDYDSPYIGISGTIESDIIKSDNKTILNSTIYLDYAAGQFLKYVITTVLLIIILISLILIQADIKLIIAAFITGPLIYYIITAGQKTKLDTLTTYYTEIINELTKEKNAR